MSVQVKQAEGGKPVVPHFNCDTEMTAAGNAVQVGITRENPVHIAITLGPDRLAYQHDHSQMQAR